MRSARGLLFFGLVCAAAFGGPPSPEAAALEPGDIVVGNRGTRVSVVDPQTGQMTPICECTKLNTLRDVAVRYGQKVYAIGQLAAEPFAQAVIEIDPVSGEDRVVTSGGNFVFLKGIAVESSGNIIVSDQDCCTNTATARGGIIRVDPSTGAQAILATGDRLVAPSGVAVGPSGDIFVATSISFPPSQGFTLASGVLRIHPTTGQQTVVAFGDDFDVPPIDRTDIIGAADVTVDKDGTIYVADTRFRGSTLEDEKRLIRVNPATGEQTLLDGVTGGSGPEQG